MSRLFGHRARQTGAGDEGQPGKNDRPSSRTAGSVLAGIPGGIGLYAFFNPKFVAPPASWQLLAALGVVLAVGVLTALPAWAHTRRPAGRALD